MSNPLDDAHTDKQPVTDDAAAGEEDVESEFDAEKLLPRGGPVEGTAPLP